MPADPATAASPWTVTAAAPGIGEPNYDAIYAAVVATAQGRWFLAQYASRNRNADTAQVLASHRPARIRGRAGAQRRPDRAGAGSAAGPRRRATAPRPRRTRRRADARAGGRRRDRARQSHRAPEHPRRDRGAAGARVVHARARHGPPILRSDRRLYRRYPCRVRDPGSDRTTDPQDRRHAGRPAKPPQRDQSHPRRRRDRSVRRSPHLPGGEREFTGGCETGGGRSQDGQGQDGRRRHRGLHSWTSWPKSGRLLVAPTPTPTHPPARRLFLLPHRCRGLWRPSDTATINRHQSRGHADLAAPLASD